MATFRLKKNLGFVFMLSMLAVLFSLLTLLSLALQKSQAISVFYLPLLIAVCIGIIILLIAVIKGFYTLYRNTRERKPGIQLTARLLRRMLFLSLVPLLVVFYFSADFLTRGIDNWFDVQVGDAMQETIELNQASLDMNQRLLLSYTQLLLNKVVSNIETDDLPYTIERLRQEIGAIELSLFGPNGAIIAYSNEDPTKILPLSTMDSERNIHQGNSQVSLVRNQIEGLMIVVKVVDSDATGFRMLASYPVSSHITGLLGNIEQAFNQYSEVSFLRNSIKRNFVYVLILVLLFGLLTTTIFAVRVARKIAAPIGAMERLATQISKGNYGQQVSLVHEGDEINSLIKAFNAMSVQLLKSRHAAESSARRVEEQRQYFETILRELNSGVITLSPDLTIHTMNQTALHLTQLDEKETLTMPETLAELGKLQPWLTPWIEQIEARLSANRPWQQDDIQLNNGNQNRTFRTSGTALRSSPPDEVDFGYALIFDDATSFVDSQRNKAWSEVARRLAHEIKNPLTPIQLSAERMRLKVMPQTQEQERQIIDKSTNTIIQQVEALKIMVNEFSEYARSPKLDVHPVVFDQIVREVTELYRDHDDIELHLSLNAGDTLVGLDKIRFRQILINLLKNAIEAMQGQTDGKILIRSQLLLDQAYPIVTLTIEDNGPGIDESIRGEIFEPYVTNKDRGTGLGLAIVKKSVEEHGGSISIANQELGAIVTLIFHVWSDQDDLSVPNQAR